MSDVPPEVISEILIHLPVKSLLRFRCVSKSFKSLIDTPEFINDHLDQQRTLGCNQLIIKADKFLWLDFTSICREDSIQQPKELQHPLKQCKVMGYCRGLVLISNALWNPSTKMLRKLPVCRINRILKRKATRYSESIFGFGYDASADDDYKVVRIAQRYYPDSQSPLVSKVMVYSLKLGVWKKVEEDCPYWLHMKDNGTFAGGALYWIATNSPLVTRNRLTIVGLNLGSERFEEVPLPEHLGNPTLNLTHLGEFLCLLLGYTDEKDDELDHVDVWVMKQSWVKMFSVKQLEGRQHFSYIRPVSYSVTGREVLLEMDHKNFLWYNVEEKELKHAKISVGLDYFESFVSLGTLVPLYGA